MGKFRNKYRIESNRWLTWDYSAPGRYFITICINHRNHILGQVRNNRMELSECGRIVQNEFLKIPGYHHRALLDSWVVMPNHVHCIITLTEWGDENGGGVDNCDGGFVGNDVEKIHEFSLPQKQRIDPQYRNHPPTDDEIKQYRKQRRKMIIPKLAGKFQMQTSKRINILRHTPGKKNWQPNYHDHVIRNDDEYWRIKNYIANNPVKWDEDRFYQDV